MGGRRSRRIGLLGAVVAIAALLPRGPTQAQPVPTAPLDGAPLCGVESPTGSPHPAADDGVLRVATFNVLHSETDEGDLSLGDRLPLLADAIARSDADVLGAQEVTRNVGFDPTAEAPQRHGLVAQRLAAAVAERTGQPWGWCWSLSNPHVPLSPDLGPGGGNPLDQAAAANGNLPDPGDFSEGVAILSRFPIEAARFRRLAPRSYEAVGCVDIDPFCPLDALFDSRQVLWARVASPMGAIDMFTTHLAHTLTELSDTTKLLQAQQALGITEEWSTPDALPDFLVGDFNSVPTSAALAATAEAGFVDTYGTSGAPDCTEVGAPGCSGGPREGEEVFTPTAQRAMSERIDYVLARPPADCDLGTGTSHVIGDVPTAQPDGRWLWPSDHVGFVSAISCSAAPAPAAGVAPVEARVAGTEGGLERLPATGGDSGGAWAWALATSAAAAAGLRRRVRRVPGPSGRCRTGL